MMINISELIFCIITNTSLKAVFTLTVKRLVLKNSDQYKNSVTVSFIFRTGLVERSQEMIDELVKLGVGQKPIIWVGHSKGGLYIKQIIINGKSQ